MDCTTFNSNNTDKTKEFLKFHGPTASNCLKKIVQEHDFEIAREKIIEDKKDGELLCKRVFSMPRPTAARLIIDGKTHTLGQDLKDYVQQNAEIRRQKDEKKAVTGN
jgi:hypothetical protein